MKTIKWILEWARSKGYGAIYGNPALVNRIMHDTDYASATDGTAVFVHLITASETAGGRDRATIGVFFSRLCDFDFDAEALLDVQQELQDTGKGMLADMLAGNQFDYSDPVRWQYGYDDYAENVAWACVRLTAESLEADCVPLEIERPQPVIADDEVTSGMAQFWGYVPLSNGFGAYCDAFTWVGISDERPIDVTYSINGVEEVGQVAACMLIDDDLIEAFPVLAHYVHKHLVNTVGYVVQGLAEVTLTVDGVSFSINHNFDQHC